MPTNLSHSRILKRSALSLAVASVLLLTALLLPAAALCQTLARPGWAGSGMKLEPWWTHAIFYEIDPHGFQDADGNGTGDLRGVTKQLDYIRSLGVDAIVLTRLTPSEGDSAAGSQQRTVTLDAPIGTFDDFDDLVREASRDGLRTLIELDPASLADPTALASAARFWLARGVAGISLRATGAPATQEQQAAQLHTLREVARSFKGQRIILGESPGGDLTLNPALATLPSLDAAATRATLERLLASSDPIVSATDGPRLARSASRYADGTNDTAIAKVLATVLLGTRANAELYFGQEIGLKTADPTASTLMPWGTPADPSAPAAKQKVGTATPRGPEVAVEEADPDSLLNWYRRLIDLHHGNAALRTGPSNILNHDEQNALVWVSRRPSVTPLSPAIVVICNLSSKPLTLKLDDDMRNLHLRGSFLRTVLRSDNGMGGMSLNAIKLPPFGVYIGELRF